MNCQTFKALPAGQTINLTSLLDRFYAESALNVYNFNICQQAASAIPREATACSRISCSRP